MWTLKSICKSGILSKLFRVVFFFFHVLHFVLVERWEAGGGEGRKASADPAKLADSRFLRRSCSVKRRDLKRELFGDLPAFKASPWAWWWLKSPLKTLLVSTRHFAGARGVWLAGTRGAPRRRRPDWAVALAVNWTMKETFVLDGDLLC